uniref:Uncharacterized protein n=1 Tax=Aegilops tauschii subsp. strangulata TaxID=200361 RepID=A0A453GTX9_AEGTS
MTAILPTFIYFFLTKLFFSWLAEGHFGFIKLPVSVYHPSHIAELTKILNMICFSCLQFKNLELRVPSRK